MKSAKVLCLTPTVPLKTFRVEFPNRVSESSFRIDPDRVYSFRIDPNRLSESPPWFPNRIYESSLTQDEGVGGDVVVAY